MGLPPAEEPAAAPLRPGVRLRPRGRPPPRRSPLPRPRRSPPPSRPGPPLQPASQPSSQPASSQPAAASQGNGGGNGSESNAGANAGSTQAAPANSNVAVRVEQPGHNGPVAQGNESNAGAAASASSQPSSTNALAAGSNPAASQPAADNGAQAGATSTQTTPSNLNASVRVASPGSDGPVSQDNASNAEAAAGATGGTAASSTPGTTSGNALPTAGSTQVDPQNVNVSVRVGSPGNNAPVTQSNVASASAATTPPFALAAPNTNIPADGTATVGNYAEIGQELEQCPEICATPLAPGGAATSTLAGAGTTGDHSSASAVQSRPSNVSVVVRVGSPGNDGVITQTNGTSADAATAVSTTTDADNLRVSVVLPGTNIVVPTGAEPWVWTWSWTTGTAPTAPDAAPTSSASWIWTWTADPAQTAPPTVTPVQGKWIWVWNWTRGDGWSTNFVSEQSCTCAWVWTWNWIWSAPDVDAPGTQVVAAQGEAVDPGVAAGATGPVTQTNTATANAAAVTTAVTTRAASVDGDATQSVLATQAANATARVDQTNVSNASFVSAGVVERLTQANEAVATAFAGADLRIAQALERQRSGLDDGAEHTTEAEQVVDIAQSATAAAHVTQSNAINSNTVRAQARDHAAIGAISQTSTAWALAVATSEASVQQTIVQSQTGAGFDQSATAEQDTDAIQAATASADTSQLRVSNIVDIEIPQYGVSNPAVTQSHVVGSVADMLNIGWIEQYASQTAAGDRVVWHEYASQTAILTQSGDAGAAAAQEDRENRAGWSGVVSPPPVTQPQSQPALFAAPSATSTTTAASASVPRSFLSILVTRRTTTYQPKLLPVVSKAPRTAAPRTAAPQMVRTTTTATPKTTARRSTPGAGNLVLPVTITDFAPPILHPELSFAPSSTALAEAHRARRATPKAKAVDASRPVAFCALCPNGLLFDSATTGAPVTGTSGVQAALSSYSRFAAPGVGRPLPSAPALGRPVTLARLERPG